MTRHGGDAGDTRIAELIQAFLDWLLDEEGVQLFSQDWFQDGCSEWHPVPYYKSREQIMAGFFKIDLNKIEQERRALLAHIRQGNT